MAKADKPLSYEELAGFCDRMATILSAGISSYEGVSAMLTTEEDPQSRIILQQIAQSLEQGHSFHHAIHKTNVFPDYVLQMIEIGEHTGNLDNVLASLAAYCRKEASIRENIHRAVFYPILMIVMMLIVMGILIVNVLPIFQDIYSELGAGMSGISYTMLYLSEWLSGHFFYLISAIAVLAVIAALVFFSPYGRGRIARTRLQREIAAARFANCMSLSLHAGLDSNQGMEFSKKLVGNLVVEESIRGCQQKVASGERFETALIASGIFSGIYNSMILIGAKTGAMDDTMGKIALAYEELSSQRLYKWISRLEPTLVIVLSVIIGVILLSFLLPLLGIMSGIG